MFDVEVVTNIVYDEVGMSDRRECTSSIVETSNGETSNGRCTSDVFFIAKENTTARNSELCCGNLRSVGSTLSLVTSSPLMLFLVTNLLLMLSHAPNYGLLCALHFP